MFMFKIKEEGFCFSVYFEMKGGSLFWFFSSSLTGFGFSWQPPFYSFPAGPRVLRDF